MSCKDNDDMETDEGNIVENDTCGEKQVRNEHTSNDSSSIGVTKPNDSDNCTSLTNCDSIKESASQNNLLKCKDIRENDIKLDGILELVDGIESQVENFREKVKSLQDEKLSLQSTVNFVSQMLPNLSQYQNRSLDSSMTAVDCIGEGKIFKDKIGIRG